jgi:hypothetical protein
MQAIIHDDPEPMPEDAAGDASLWEIVARGLAKKPSERYTDMTEFGEALALWLYERGIKEDLSGNSIRAVWLDRVLTLTHLEIESSLPPSRKQTLPASASSQSVATIPGTRATLRARKQRLFFAVALVAGIGIGGVVVALSLGTSRKTNGSAPSATASTVVIDSAQAPLVANSAPEAAKVDPANPPAAESPSVPEPTAQKRTSPKPQSSPRSNSRTPKRSHDFGF